jgi:glycosyltransferase involved in cell wall biosynthesis
MLPPFSVVIPAYNEGARLGYTIRQTCAYLAREAPKAELIVVNDGSTDDTSDIAREAMADAQIKTLLMKMSPNHGKGAAVRKGLLTSTRPIAIFFDADLSTPLEEIPKIVQPIATSDVDLVFGSRALDRRLIGRHQSWRREQGGRVFNLLVRLVAGLPYWDTQCGFKAFRMDVCKEIIEAGEIDGFAFDVELLYLAKKAGLRLREVPVRWNHVEGSKINLVHDSIRMFREVLALRRRAGDLAIAPG